MNTLELTINGKVLVIGTINGDVFSRTVKPQHFCYKHKGYGIQEEAFEKLLELGIQTINFNGSKKYTSSIGLWKEFGIKDNLGHGNQIFLPIIKMKEL